MNISGDLHEFSQRNVSKAPIGKGVYSLHKAGETIYIGKAEGEGGIRERLQAHMRMVERRAKEKLVERRRNSFPCNFLMSLSRPG